MHTDNTNDTGDANKIEFQFMAIVVNTDDLFTATNYHITAGVEYGNEEYVWIGEATVSTDLVNEVSS